MKVRAIRLGYYGDQRQREGDVFVLSDASHFSDKWMEKLEDAPKKRGRPPKKKEEQVSSSEQSVI